MCNNFNWNAFSAVFTAIGAIATSGALIYTLCELRLKSKDKILIKMCDNYVSADEPDISYIGVSVTNIGYKPTSVKYIGFTSRRQKKKHSRFVFFPISKNYNKLIDSHLDEFYLLSRRDNLSHAFTEDIENGLYEKDERIYICVVTAMDTHFLRTKLKFNEFYNKQQ